MTRTAILSVLFSLSALGCGPQITQITTPNSQGYYVFEDSGVTWRLNPNEVDQAQGIVSAYSDWDKVIKAELHEMNCADDLSWCQEDVLLFSEHLDPWIWTEDTQTHTLYVCEMFQASVYDIHLSYDEDAEGVEFYRLLGQTLFFIGGAECYPEAFGDSADPP